MADEKGYDDFLGGPSIVIVFLNKTDWWHKQQSVRKYSVVSEIRQRKNWVLH